MGCCRSPSDSKNTSAFDNNVVRSHSLHQHSVSVTRKGGYIYSAIATQGQRASRGIACVSRRYHHNGVGRVTERVKAKPTGKVIGVAGAIVLQYALVIATVVL